MQNYLELLDRLLVCEITTEPRAKAKERDNEEKEEKLLCGAEGMTIRVFFKSLIINYGLVD